MSTNQTRESIARSSNDVRGLVLKGSARSGERGKVRWKSLLHLENGNEVTRFDAAGVPVAASSSGESEQQKSEEDATLETLSGNVKVRPSEAVC